MPTIDFTRFLDEALLRSREFLHPGPVPMARTQWDDTVAGCHGLEPAMRNGRLTARKWAEIRRFLAAAADRGCSKGRPWSSSLSTQRATAKVAEADKMADIPGNSFQA